jgi:hypothetical protein
MFTKLMRLVKPRRGKGTPDEPDFERHERERLTAQNTGSFVPNRGPEYGITTKPPK